MAETARPAQKDRLLGELFDLTPARTIAFIKGLRQATEARDFVESGIRAICPEHHQSRRAEAIGDLLGCSVKTGQRISAHDGDYARAWPLLMAGHLRFMSLHGTILSLVETTGMDESMAEALIRRHLGEER